MDRTLTRLCINKNIQIHDGLMIYDFEQLCEHIDFWKVILIEKYKVQVGQTCYIDFNILNIHTISFMFALAELGLIIAAAFNREQLNKNIPVEDDQIKVDYIFMPIYEVQPEINNSNSVIIPEEIYYTYKIKDPEIYKTMSTLFLCDEDTQLFLDYSSKPDIFELIYLDHKKVVVTVNGIATQLGFKNGESALHVGAHSYFGFSNIFTHILSTFIKCTDQFLLSARSNSYNEISSFVNKNKINNILVGLPTDLLEYLTVTEKIDHYLNITTYFQIFPKVINLLKEKNITSVKSSFGDRNISVGGVFIKVVTKETDLETYDIANMGKLTNNIFDVKIEDGVLYIAIPEIQQEWATNYDMFEIIDDDYYFRGRKQSPRYNGVWIDKKKIENQCKSFFQDAIIKFDDTTQQIQIQTSASDDEKEIFFNSLYLKNELPRLGVVFL